MNKGIRTKIDENYDSLIAYIGKEGVRDILQMAISEYAPGFDGVVIWNNGSLSSYCWSSNTTSGNEMDIEIYRLTDSILDGEEVCLDIFDESDIEKSILRQLEYEQRCNWEIYQNQ